MLKPLVPPRIILYLVIFKCKIDPFLRINHNKDVPYLVGGNEPLHSCSNNASDVRQEVFLLRGDFNNRFKQIIFTSVLNAYYASFIPISFIPRHLFYNRFWVTQHMFFTWVSLFTMCAGYCFPIKYCDVLHRSGWLSSVNVLKLHANKFPSFKPFTWVSGQNLDHERLTRHLKTGVRRKSSLMGVTSNTPVRSTSQYQNARAHSRLMPVIIVFTFSSRTLRCSTSSSARFKCLSFLYSSSSSFTVRSINTS